MLPYTCSYTNYNFLNSEYFKRITKLSKATISCVMSVRPSALNSFPTARISIKFDIWFILQNSREIFKFHSNVTRITVTLHEGLCTFMTISRWNLPRIGTFSDESCSENQNTRFMYRNYFSPKIVPFVRFIHSTMSYDRSTDSSKASSPQSAI
jgi:hypothetical protein